MPDNYTIASAIASVVSAIGGAFAAVAAYRSAESARQATEAAQAAEKRAALRQLTITAHEIIVEAKRAEARATELKGSYRSLFALSGSSGGSREGLYLAEVDKKLQEAARLLTLAEPFSSVNKELANGPIEEIEARDTTLTQALIQARAIREDFERQHSSVESQCAPYREKAIRGPGGK